MYDGGEGIAILLMLVVTTVLLLIGIGVGCSRPSKTSEIYKVTCSGKVYNNVILNPNGITYYSGKKIDFRDGNCVWEATS